MRVCLEGIALHREKELELLTLCTQLNIGILQGTGCIVHDHAVVLVCKPRPLIDERAGDAEIAFSIDLCFAGKECVEEY